jgi:hypothetical protein
LSSNKIRHGKVSKKNKKNRVLVMMLSRALGLFWIQIGFGKFRVKCLKHKAWIEDEIIIIKSCNWILDVTATIEKTL